MDVGGVVVRLVVAVDVRGVVVRLGIGVSVAGSGGLRVFVLVG